MYVTLDELLFDPCAEYYDGGLGYFSVLGILAEMMGTVGIKVESTFGKGKPLTNFNPVEIEAFRKAFGEGRVILDPPVPVYHEIVTLYVPLTEADIVYTGLAVSGIKQCNRCFALVQASSSSTEGHIEWHNRNKI